MSFEYVICLYIKVMQVFCTSCSNTILLPQLFLSYIIENFCSIAVNISVNVKVTWPQVLPRRLREFLQNLKADNRDIDVRILNLTFHQKMFKQWDQDAYAQGSVYCMHVVSEFDTFF